MGILDSIKGGATSAYGKAKDSAEIAKLNLKANDEKRRQEAQFAVLGKAYYLRHGEDAEECFQSTINQIKEYQANIDEINVRIESLKNGMKLGRTCVFCGAAIADDARFCTVCGKEQGEEAPVQEEVPDNVRRCMFCGAAIADDAKFCTSCGKKQEEAAAPGEVIDENQEDS